MNREPQPIDTLRWIERNELEANDYNPNHVPPIELELLKRSILETGWTQPIVLAADCKTIIDGFHRWTVSGHKEMIERYGTQVPVVLCNIGKEHRIFATIRHNRARGYHGIRHMSSIVLFLKQKGLSTQQIMQELGMQEEEVLRLTEVREQPKFVAEVKTEFSRGWTPSKEA